MLSTQWLISLVGHTKKTEFLCTAVVVYECARDSLSHVAPHQLTYKKLYGDLQSALQLRAELKLEPVLRRATTSNVQIDDRITDINYSGHFRICCENSSGAVFKDGKQKSPVFKLSSEQSRQAEHIITSPTNMGEVPCRPPSCQAQKIRYEECGCLPLVKGKGSSDW